MGSTNCFWVGGWVTQMFLFRGLGSTIFSWLRVYCKIIWHRNSGYSSKKEDPDCLNILYMSLLGVAGSVPACYPDSDPTNTVRTYSDLHCWLNMYVYFFQRNKTPIQIIQNLRRYWFWLSKFFANFTKRLNFTKI